jgi:hypothetical protein
LEITVSFLGIHKWEPGIYIGFSLALHLQCICRDDDPVQLPADGDVGAGLDGGPLQGHVHEGRSHQKPTKLEPNQTREKTKTKPKHISPKMIGQESGLVIQDS